ncbi:hypothetical protein M0R19_03160 [Candidatus Pacearchaeota archaeon]|jgi:hypothetical protein|nr:hypothetical protein [Candidatus Pacearchaeota archaeon]
MYLDQSYQIINLTNVQTAITVTSGTYITANAGYSTINISELDEIYGYHNWKLILQCLWFNVPNTRVMKMKMGFSRVLASLDLKYTDESYLTNSAGGARSAFGRISITPDEIIALLSQAETETVVWGGFLGCDAGTATNLSVYAVNSYIIPSNYPIYDIFQLGVG